MPRMSVTWGFGADRMQRSPERARQERRVLVSADLGFANILDHPPGSHPGIVVSRFPNETTTTDLCRALLAAIKSVTDDEIEGALVIVEPHRIRLRRAPQR